MKRTSIDRGFAVALAASEFSDAPRRALKMGASLYSGSRLLSIGANLFGRSHPDSANSPSFYRSTHCEHVALLRRKHYESTGNLTLYVARIRADGSFGCSKPCDNCMNLMKLAGVTRVRFFDENGNQKELLF
jgi:deoxycytidylate deaminase